MKSSISTLVLAALIAVASLSQAHAQTPNVNVPFAFDFGSGHFGPGTYTVSISLDRQYLMLRSETNGGLALVNVSDGPRNHERGYVTFRKYGNRYFLAGYHPTDSASTVQVMPSKKERVVARNFTPYQPEPGRVQLALNEASGR
jgi:hypothetical protein